MSEVTTILPVVAILGSALIAGVFFAFSSFVMKALARIPSEQGIAAMQSINVVVINPSFLGAFMGTAVVSLALAVLAIMGWGTPSSIWLFAGAMSYLLGTFLVTLMGNVPLNNQLAAVLAADTAALPVWQHYLDRWTMMNSVRTSAALVSAIFFTIGLLQLGD